MSTPAQSDLAKAFTDVASNYRGSDVDLHAIYRDMRANSPVLQDNFMARLGVPTIAGRSEEHTSELQSRLHIVCRLLLEKTKRICKT